jgi:hypothetical protein
MSECLRRWRGASGGCDEWGARGAKRSIATRMTVFRSGATVTALLESEIALEPLPRNQRRATTSSR